MLPINPLSFQRGALKKGNKGDPELPSANDPDPEPTDKYKSVITEGNQDSYGRRKWEVHKERNDEEEDEEDIIIPDIGPAFTRNLGRRTQSLGLDMPVGKRQQVFINPDKPHENNVFHCDLCEVSCSDSQTWLDHLNGRRHNRLMGFNMRVERVGVDIIKAKLANLSQKTLEEKERQKLKNQVIMNKQQELEEDMLKHQKGYKKQKIDTKIAKEIQPTHLEKMKSLNVKQKVQNPDCFFEISISGERRFKLVFRLYWDITPITCENFKCLCTGEKGKSRSGRPLLFKGSRFHRIIKNFMAQGGDFTVSNGTGGESIFGTKFNDENFIKKHTKKGQLSMANSGPNTNGSQFFLTFDACPWLDSKHVVFGECIEGLEHLSKIENVGSQSGKPFKSVQIVDSGIIETVNQDEQGQNYLIEQNIEEIQEQADNNQHEQEAQGEQDLEQRQEQEYEYEQVEEEQNKEMQELDSAEQAEYDLQQEMAKYGIPQQFASKFQKR